VAAENAPNRGFDRFAARFIRGNQIRGHDENAPDHGNSAIADEQADVCWLFPELGLVIAATSLGIPRRLPGQVESRQSLLRKKTLLRIPFDRETSLILQALRLNGNGLLSRADRFHDLGGE